MSFTIKRGPVAADNYTIISNAMLRDFRISLKARGLGAWLLSHRDDFQLTQKRIAEMNGCGEALVRSAVDELEAVGYLRRERSRDDETGQLGGSVYYMTDSPVDAGQAQDAVSHDRETQSRETEAHKKNTSKKTTSKAPAAAASEPVLDLPGVEDELAKRRQDREEAEDPTPLTINQRANVLAGRHYERLGKMGNVPGMMKIIRKALEHGFPDEQVDRACEWLADRRWTLTEEKLANTLRGGARRAGAPPTTTDRPEVRTGRMILET